MSSSYKFNFIKALLHVSGNEIPSSGNHLRNKVLWYNATSDYIISCRLNMGWIVCIQIMIKVIIEFYR